MNHVSLDDQDDNVKQFVLGLAVEGGSVLELGGKAVACVLPAPLAANGSAADWTEARNGRRIELIGRKYGGSLTPAETVELAGLQEEMLRYRQRVAPLPLEDARKLHQELLTRAAMRKSVP